MMEVTGLLLALLLAQPTTSLATTLEYQFVDLSKTWHEAQSYCRERFADLATVESAEDWARVREMITDSGHNLAWIGLYEARKSWRWSIDGTNLYQDGVINLGSWFDFLDDNYDARQLCVFVENGQLKDRGCEDLQFSLCYDKPTNTYIPVTIAKTWPEARSYCREKYTDLASMRSQQEKESIMNVTDVTTWWWVGLSRDGWKWSDRSNSSFRVWGDTEPNGSGEDCALVLGDVWADATCSNPYPFICSVRRERLLKLELKKVGAVDLNDPQIQEALVEQVEMRFRAQGVDGGFRLTWRTQPHGQVFNSTAGLSHHDDASLETDLINCDANSPTGPT